MLMISRVSKYSCFTKPTGPTSVEVVFFCLRAVEEEDERRDEKVRVGSEN